MKSDEVENERKKRVVNIVELSDGELVYIRLDDEEKYLLNGDGCWRCGSTADCFGNMDDNELEVICEFDFYDEVRSLFLLLLQERVTKLASGLSEKIHGKVCILIDRLVDAFARTVEQVNLKQMCARYNINQRIEHLT